MKTSSIFLVYYCDPFYQESSIDAIFRDKEDAQTYIKTKKKVKEDFTIVEEKLIEVD